ncbi:MAG TPA: protein kinase [Gemmatimonadales bacterium]|nr:protein kinase [Gemmatimonadales bacterium]
MKVMDFGIAKVVEAMNQTNTQSVGTLQYMSPEQIDAQTVDQRTDLYCLGLVFYELLAGHPPFQSSSPRTLLNMQCTEAPPALPDDVRAGLPKGIERVLWKLLEKEPDKRPAGASEVVEQLELFLPEKSFAGLGDVSVVAKSSRTVPSSGAARTERPGEKHDTLPSVEDTPVPRSPRTSSPRKEDAAKGKAGDKRITERKDTVALIDEAARGRELSTGLSVIIIVALMLLSGLATYIWRASQEAAPESSAETDS